MSKKDKAALLVAGVVIGVPIAVTLALVALMQMYHMLLWFGMGDISAGAVIALVGIFWGMAAIACSIFVFELLKE